MLQFDMYVMCVCVCQAGKAGGKDASEEKKQLE